MSSGPGSAQSASPSIVAFGIAVAKNPHRQSTVPEKPPPKTSTVWTSLVACCEEAEDPSQVALELGALVVNTTIYGHDDPRFEKVTERFNTFAIPNIQLVVEPGIEGDIPVIVTYCAQNSIDFLPVNRGHGYPVSLASFTGIQISMARLTTIEINHKDTDSKAAITETAWFQAGVYAKQVTDYLWERGYIATTGTCECVGLLGPGLGGGHGKLEGTYGLVSDNIRQLNSVLADGSAITVNGTSHADLFWALGGL
ncbi:hypothetical protein BDV19DRAFT_391616 [Aspergillus venezuelensis]